MSDLESCFEREVVINEELISQFRNLLHVGQWKKVKTKLAQILNIQANCLLYVSWSTVTFYSLTLKCTQARSGPQFTLPHRQNKLMSKMQNDLLEVNFPFGKNSRPLIRKTKIGITEKESRGQQVLLKKVKAVSS